MTDVLVFPTAHIASRAKSRAPKRHPRGVFIDDSSWHGLIVLRAYTCRGELIRETTVPQFCLREEEEHGMWSFLNEYCPSQHGAVCPFDQQRVAHLMGQNRALQGADPQAQPRESSAGETA